MKTSCYGYKGFFDTNLRVSRCPTPLNWSACSEGWILQLWAEWRRCHLTGRCRGSAYKQQLKLRTGQMTSKLCSSHIIPCDLWEKQKTRTCNVGVPPGWTPPDLLSLLLHSCPGSCCCPSRPARSGRARWCSHSSPPPDTCPVHNKLDKSALNTWTGGHLEAAEESYLLQQVSDELLMATASLAALSDVGRRHYLLTQTEVFTVHLCQTNSLLRRLVAKEWRTSAHVTHLQEVTGQ